jgi:hypothetical protein
MMTHLSLTKIVLDHRSYQGFKWKINSVLYLPLRKKKRPAENACTIIAITVSKIDSCLPRNETARPWPRSQFLHSNICERFIHSIIGMPIRLQQNRQPDPGNIKHAYRYMNVEFGRQDIIIMFWKWWGCAV